MDITISTDEYMEIQRSQSAKDVQIAQLEAQVAAMKNDCNHWKNRAIKAEELLKVENIGETAEKKCTGKFIILSVDRIKSVLSKIHDLKILSVFAFLIQKTLHRDDDSAPSCTIADIMPMPQLPNISLTAEGDIQVEGDLNDIHDNDNVNL